MTNIDFASLRLIGLNHSIASRLHLLDKPPADARLLRVSAVQRDRLGVHDGHNESGARVLPALLKELQQQGLALAVGDWVLVEGSADGEQWIARRLEPLNHLARRDSAGQRQAIASNVDTALLVMGLDHDFNPRRLERYLSMVHAAGVAPVVVMSKADIVVDVAARMQQLRQRLPAQLPLLALNGLSGDAAAQLAPWLGAGQTLVLLGSSGAGKSTLTNTLCQAAQATGAVRADDSHGRHTTTARSLHRCAGGACIIDTPGLRSWQPDADEQTLAAGFDDIAALAARCQFRDCRHDCEPGCAVRGAVDADRLRNYHKLLRQARLVEQTPLERIAERAKWKAITRAPRKRAMQGRE